MVRAARTVIPDFPHHVIQRGVRRMNTFNQKSDYEAYLSFVAEGCENSNTEVLAYCLMPNHVHFIMVPRHEDGLRGALANAHRRFARMINLREECTGHLWQDRFHSFPMDESHLLVCLRYVELNPVKALLVERPEQWLWSSARARILGKPDKLINTNTLKDMVPDWKALLDVHQSDDEVKKINEHNSSGYPLGNEGWIRKLEKQYDRSLIAKKAGRKKQILIGDSNQKS